MRLSLAAKTIAKRVLFSVAVNLVRLCDFLHEDGAFNRILYDMYQWGGETSGMHVF